MDNWNSNDKVLNDQNNVGNQHVPNYVLEVYRALISDPYSVIDCMLPEELNSLKQLIEEEIYLRSFNKKRLTQIKTQLLKEKEKFKNKLLKEQQKLAKHQLKNESDSESEVEADVESEEEVVVKPKKKPTKRGGKR